MTPSYEGQSLFINTTFATKAEVRWSLVDQPKTTALQCSRSTGTQGQPSFYNNVDPKRWIPLVVRARGEEETRVWLWPEWEHLEVEFSTADICIFKRWKYAMAGRRGRVHGNRARTFQQNSLHTVRKRGTWGAGRRQTGFSAQHEFSRCVWHSLPWMSASQSFSNDAYLRRIIGWHQSFMADRYSTVVINPQAPEFFTGTIGLPQSSPVSPIRKSLPSRRPVGGLWTPWQELPVLWDS